MAVTVSRNSTLVFVLIRLVSALLGGDSTSGGGEDTSGTGGNGGEGSVFDILAGFGRRAPVCFEEEGTDRKDEVGVIMGDDAETASSFPSGGSTLLVDELLEGHMTVC